MNFLSWGRRSLGLLVFVLLCFFFHETATTEIYTLSLHDALPISEPLHPAVGVVDQHHLAISQRLLGTRERSEEHTSELQSQSNLVCRLLLEKKKTITSQNHKLTTQMHCSHDKPRHHPTPLDHIFT